MRIGNSSIDQLGTSGTGAIGGANSDARAANAGGGYNADSVSLSNAASLVALAKSDFGSRQARVQDIGNQVQSGSYDAQISQVSQALIQGHIS